MSADKSTGAQQNQAELDYRGQEAKPEQRGDRPVLTGRVKRPAVRQESRREKRGARQILKHALPPLLIGIVVIAGIMYFAPGNEPDARVTGYLTFLIFVVMYVQLREAQETTERSLALTEESLDQTRDTVEAADREFQVKYRPWVIPNAAPHLASTVMNSTTWDGVRITLTNTGLTPALDVHHYTDHSLASTEDPLDSPAPYEGGIEGVRERIDGLLATSALQVAGPYVIAPSQSVSIHIKRPRTTVVHPRREPGFLDTVYEFKVVHFHLAVAYKDGAGNHHETRMCCHKRTFGDVDDIGLCYHAGGSDMS